MNKKNKVSVIIPVYNVELYLEQCLSSVINQTYENLEILCVNDGSNDKSGEICERYTQKDARIKVFHKQNGGVSQAKNVGLQNATGKYVSFVDSDDWIEPDMVEILYKAAEEIKAGIVVCNYFKETDGQIEPMSNRKKIPAGIISGTDMMLFALKRDYYMGFCGYIWNKLFLRENIVNLWFDEDIDYGEDVLFFAQVALYLGCYGTYIKKPLYHYRQRKNSIAHTKTIGVKTHILKAYKRIEALINKTGAIDTIHWARGFYCYHALVVAEIASDIGDLKTFEVIRKEIREHFSDYIRTNEEFPEKLARIHEILGNRGEKYD
jgi:glycosyltransferase involved in cell wall biosynthesis